ncbi:MAG: type II secretion system protein GspJ [Deltaproteobacteria bacterium]|nr:type II secretion system protein GspJ [Deltaproteobacteria bacterium]
MKTQISAINRGFTLLELLLTLSIFSAIMALLLDSYFQFHINQKKTDEVFLLRQEIRALEKILRDDLQSAVYLTKFVNDPLLNRKSGILGSSHTIGDAELDEIHMHVNHPSKFYRDLPLAKDPFIHEVSFFIEEDVDQNLLFKRREEYYIDDDIKAGDRSVVYTLSQKVLFFDIKYFDAKNPQNEPLDDWESKRNNPLPSGVRITLKLKSPKGNNLTETFEINIQPDMGSFIAWE